RRVTERRVALGGGLAGRRLGVGADTGRAALRGARRTSSGREQFESRVGRSSGGTGHRTRPDAHVDRWRLRALSWAAVGGLARGSGLGWRRRSVVGVLRFGERI